MEKEDRGQYYKEPMKFGAVTVWESKTLADIEFEQWKTFDKAVKANKNFKLGDFINLSVELTAKHLVKFLDEFTEMESIEEVNKKAQEYIDEFKKEIKL